MKSTGKSSLLRRALLGTIAAVAASTAVAQVSPVSGTASNDGTVTLEGVTVPPSSLLSPEGAAYLRHLIVDKPFAAPPGVRDIKAERARQDQIMLGFLKPMRERYKVNVAEEWIGGILTDVVTPADGIAPENRDRLLINVHGGGFTTGARTASLVESVPLAALMRIKVVSIDYRMAPEHAFPAASEDVAKVYRALLKHYSPSHMVLYGCSAGGMLTAESIAWFQAHALPNPAAIGIFCASLDKFGTGDSAHLAGPLLGMHFSAPATDRKEQPKPPGYFDGVKDDNALAYPLRSPALLAKFPPTLFISGTRSFEFSAALDSHNQLAKAGVDTRFFGWDGMFHGFFYNSELPESREAYAVMVRFFEDHLAK